MKHILITILSLIGILVSGCATGTVVITGKVREPIPFESVKILQQYPPNYESIAIVNSKSEEGVFTNQRMVDLAIEALKKQAAKVGANAVVLKTHGQQSAGTVGNVISTGGGGGVFAGGNVMYNVFSGDAIYTEE